MRFFITSDANWEARIDGVTDYFALSGYKETFESRNYGKGLCGVSIILMCRDPSLKFKRRIRLDKKKNKLYMDIMFDLDQMREAQDDLRKKIVVDRLADEIPRILNKYTLPDFDKTRFLEDINGWLKKMR